jgi:catechol 2,3-dioxygenase-like lactoylglutathione lyase family enzyme
MAAQPALYFVVLYVSDLDASTDYFTRTLGFTSDPGQSGDIFRFLHSGPGGIDFGINLVGDDTPPAGTVELYFKTDDVSAVHTDLTAKGLAATPVVSRPFGTIFSVQSPDGAPLVFLQEPQR